MAAKKIHFYTHRISFSLREKSKISRWLLYAALNEGFGIDRLDIIFCSDHYLLKLNNDYLNHNYFTDIITFDFSVSSSGKKKTPLIGELYISIHRVRDNAKKLRIDFTHELHRVMIHGLLHLLGYKDKIVKHVHVMRAREDYYLSLL